MCCLRNGTSVTAPPSQQVVALEAEVDSLRSRLADAERCAAGSAGGGAQIEANGAGGAGRSEHDFNELEAELLGWPSLPTVPPKASLKAAWVSPAAAGEEEWGSRRGGEEWGSRRGGEEWVRGGGSALTSQRGAQAPRYGV